MDLSILRGDIQKIVSVNAKCKPLTIDLALGLIGGYMLQKAGNSISEWEAMKTFLAYLCSKCFRGNKKAIITKGCFHDCVLYIQYHMSDLPFEKKRGTLLSLGLKVITGVENNGCLSFNKNTFASYASQTMINGKSANNYIVDSMVDEINDKGVDSKTVITQDEQTTDQEKESSDAVEILIAEKKPRNQNVCTDNSPFIHLYDELIAANSENRKNAKFVWQWFLKLDEYEAIKACLTNNELPTSSKWDVKTVHLLALYIGEYHKREYENNVNPFAQLGGNTPNSKFGDYSQICKWLNIKPYRKGYHVHRNTLFVNGGLPIHYYSTKLDNAQSNKFIDGLSKLLYAENNIDISEGEEELGKYSGNISLKESYQKGIGHSIYEYIQAIMAHKQTWDDSDNDSLEFRDFINKIMEANKKAAERKKFKLFYSLWTYIHESNFKEFSLQPQIRFNPEEDGNRHYAISIQRLENWGIKDPPAQFSLRLGDKEMIFTKCCKGDFISWDLTDRIDLNRLDCNLTSDDLLHSDFTIIFDKLNGETTPIRNDFNLPFKKGFLQFYTDDDPSMASWNSYKGANSFLMSGVLYDKTRYHLLPPASSININEDLGWVTFIDCIALKDTKNNKIHTFYNSKGQIYAKPSEESLHRNIIDSPCLLPNCLLDGMAECTIGEVCSYAYIVKSSNLKFDVFRVANDEKVNSNPLVEYKSAQEYLNSSSPWNKYQYGNLEKGLYVFRVYNARYSTEVTCLVLPDNAKIELYNRNKPYLIKFIGFTTVSLEGVRSLDRNNIFKIYNNNSDSFNFTIGEDNGSISLQTYHPKPQIHVYRYYEEIDIKKQPVLIAYADDIEVKYISAEKCDSKQLFEFNGLYKRLFDTLTATVTGNKNQLLTQRINLNIEGQGDLEVRVYTQEMNGTQEAKNEAIKLMLLDLDDNSIKEITGTDTIKQAQQIVKETKHDGLLFQSLKNIDYVDVYYAPRFIPKNGQKLVGDAKTDERKSRLTSFAEKEKQFFASDCAFGQFRIACEHRIYFAVFDSLLSMCWDAKKKCFLDTNRKPFKKNVLSFLNGYSIYTTNKSAEPSIAGLKRLAKEFLFDWGIIKSDVENTGSQQLKELYQEIINN